MGKTPHQQRIEQFMEKAEQLVPTKPAIPSEVVRRLRATLILEEALETIKALGCSVAVQVGQSRHTDCIGLLEIHHYVSSCNLVEVLDGCADISVVTIGTLSAFGVIDSPLLEEVDKSNLAKFGDGGYKRKDGKWVKPPNWLKPDINSVIDEQISQAELW
jgi:predicted HAD superfamily Cof-like phosphohydrolase